jgi:hypothetical protein
MDRPPGPRIANREPPCPEIQGDREGSEVRSDSVLGSRVAWRRGLFGNHRPAFNFKRTTPLHAEQLIMTRKRAAPQDPLARLPKGRWVGVPGGLPSVPLTFGAIMIVTRRGGEVRRSGHSPAIHPNLTVQPAVLAQESLTSVPHAHESRSVVVPAA